MGAGQAEYMPPPGQLGMQAQRTQDLGFFAAHHIGRAGFSPAGKAGQDGNGAPGRFKAQGRGRDGLRFGRALQIGHFAPADGRTHHAAEYGGQNPIRLVPGRHRSSKSRAAIGHGSTFSFRPRQHMAARVAEVKPQPAGAPVPGNKNRLAHGGLLHRKARRSKRVTDRLFRQRQAAMLQHRADVGILAVEAAEHGAIIQRMPPR